MGSFRIVTGSGYGRREITSGAELAREFDKLKVVAERASAAKPVVRTRKKTASSRTKHNIESIYDKIWNDAVRKANKWARETVAEMRANVPVDTGNLQGSIHILKDKCYQDKATGEILMVVGADLDPSGGYRKLYPPPYMKRSPRYGRKNAPWKGYRIMPKFPNEYASKFLGEPTIEQRFKAISEKNAKKIMGK